MARPREFDEDTVLEAAMRTFWARGYDGTSMTELLAAMGIQKGSFYAAFESKHAVFLAGLRRYQERQSDLFAHQMDGLPPLDGLRAHFRGMVKNAVTAEGGLGCHVMNSGLELAHRDPEVAALVRDATKRHRALYRRKLDAAVADGSLPADTDTAARSAALLALLFGLQASARSGVGPAWIRDLGRQFDALLEPAP